MKHTLLLFFLVLTLSAKTITPNDVYAHTALIQEHLKFLLKFYKIKHHHHKIINKTLLTSPVQPRDTWQKTFEILVKINILRDRHGYTRIEPIGMEPIIDLNPSMVYGMASRVLTELKIYEMREEISVPKFKLKHFSNKTPLDVFNNLSHISASFDELNHSEPSASYIFSESMRIYDDLTIILRYLSLQDNTIPTKRLKSANIKDVEQIALKMLDTIQSFQRIAGIKVTNLSQLVKKNSSRSDIYTFIGILLAELQPIKAHIGLTKSVTPPGLTYERKTIADVEQLMQWNLKKLSLIKNMDRR